MNMIYYYYFAAGSDSDNGVTEAEVDPDRVLCRKGSCVLNRNKDEIMQMKAI